MLSLNLLHSSLRTGSVLLATFVFAYSLPVLAQTLPTPNNLRFQGQEQPPGGDTRRAYQYVVPNDVGHTIGVGVIGPAPTKAWTASTAIDTPNTVIENVVVNGCLDILADNVKIKNVVVNCNGTYPIEIRAKNLSVEYSTINCTSSSKAFLAQNPGAAFISKNEIVGCEDFFFINGNVDGMVVEDNYMHSVIGGSDAHADGFQIGEQGDTYGSIAIRGNYIWKNNDTIGATDIVFNTNYSRVTLLVENNFFRPWGHYTLRCNEVSDVSTCIARNNTYSLEFLDPEQVAMKTQPQTSFQEFTCNRYENGVFLQQNNGDTSDCPPVN